MISYDVKTEDRGVKTPRRSPLAALLQQNRTNNPSLSTSARQTIILLEPNSDLPGLYQDHENCNTPKEKHNNILADASNNA
eukprot:scaffold33389_cov91-Cyclotella_meneghiniana.AAC.1